MTTNIHSINLPKIVQIGWGHHVDFCVWKNRPLLLAKGVERTKHPSPIGHGWELVNGKCRPVRNIVPPLPEQLRDIGSSNESSDESGDDEGSEYGISSSSDEE